MKLHIHYSANYYTSHMHLNQNMGQKSQETTTTKKSVVKMLLPEKYVNPVCTEMNRVCPHQEVSFQVDVLPQRYMKRPTWNDGLTGWIWG